MNEIVTLLQKQGMLFKRLEPIDPKTLNSRKKITIYEGVDLKSYYTAIFILRQKSRFLRKNADEIEALFETMKSLRDYAIKKKVLVYEMPFCSKAQALMKERGWRLIDAAG